MQEERRAPSRTPPSEVSRPSYPAGLDAGADATLTLPGPGVPPPRTRVTPDFSRINFDRLWSGREKVTAVEGAILSQVLAQELPGPALEIGSGSGRLVRYLTAWSRDLVVSDATLSFLCRQEAYDPSGPARVAANVYHLPFADEVFAAATLIRVFGFLTDPGAALREVHRVLRARGLLILSFEPHPTVGSLIDDLKMGLARPHAGTFRTMTFSREPTVPVRPTAYPAWSHTRAHLGRLAEAAGFALEREYPCGLEDLFVFRRLSVSFFLSLSQALTRMGGFPTRFVTLRK